jgi:uncharacterized protein (TIRG00374 family)
MMMGKVIKIAISIAVLWFLFHAAQIKLGLLTNLLQQPLLLLTVIFMFLMMVLLAAWRWYQLNTSLAIQLGFFKTLHTSYLAASFNNVLPGAIGGDIVRLASVFKVAPEKKSLAVLSVFFDRVLGFLAIFISICAVSFFYLDSLKQHPKLFSLVSVCALFSVSLLIGFTILMVLTRRIGLNAWLAKRFPHKRWSRWVISLCDAISDARISKTIIVKCLLLSISMQLLIVGTVFVIAKMMGISAIRFSDFMLSVGVTQIVNLLPITPGGVGIGEMAFANVLSLLNPGITAAFATIFFAYRIISVVAYLPGVIWYAIRFVLLPAKIDRDPCYDSKY